MATTIPLRVGDSVSFSKTVGESDVYLFAGITGDFSPNHVNEEAMKGTAYGRRVAHGVLSLGFASTTSTLMIENSGMTAVSYGYDRVRFVAPILVGDTITANYTIAEIDEETAKTYADIEVVNQRGELCTTARHILKLKFITYSSSRSGSTTSRALSRSALQHSAKRNLTS